MPNISIKDVPEQWAETLRQRAARNHRSLQGELMAIIERAVQETAQPAVELGQSPVGRPPQHPPRLENGRTGCRRIEGQIPGARYRCSTWSGHHPS